MTQAATNTPQTGEPFSEQRTQQILSDFYRDGYALIPGVLTADEVATLREKVDAVFADPGAQESNTLYGSFVAARLFERDRYFRDMLVREPIISLCEAVLGENCHLMAQNVVRNAPGEAIDTFHVDDALEFPLPEVIARHDSRIRMPVFRMTVQIPLTDIESEDLGPSQFVPGSHYSGRQPNDPKNPSFEGRGPVSVLCKAGDIYLHNGQCWHRGAPNRSDRVRYLLQHSMSVRWVAQRFYPFVNYQFPEGVLDGASDRLRRVLGFHTKGAYG